MSPISAKEPIEMWNVASAGGNDVLLTSGNWLSDVLMASSSSSSEC
jgi:hypothetical protein